MALWIADGEIGPTFKQRREIRLLWRILTAIALVGLCDGTAGRITECSLAKTHVYLGLI
jgi:hypothetical protein